MAQAKIIGVLGFPVEHSQSPQIFRSFFEQEGLSDWTYEKFSFENLSTFIEYVKFNKEITGFNVTIPHKQDILKYLHEIDPEALKIGAVNTVSVKRSQDGNIHLKGYNTDYYGFKSSLKSLPTMPENALIIGTGGASKAVSAVLKDMGIPFVFISRNPSQPNCISYSEFNLYITKPNTVLINTTPIGMSGFAEKQLPLSIESLPNDCQVIDLIYNPKKTMLLSVCEKKGINCLNGSLMLEKQAAMAWEIFKTIQ